jgi:hypothetical protein
MPEQVKKVETNVSDGFDTIRESLSFADKMRVSK